MKALFPQAVMSCGPNADTQVTLEATVQKYSEEIDYWVCRTKTFTVTVAKNGSMSVESDLDDVEIVYAAGDNAGSVTASVYLTSTGATGCRITWTSSNTGYITATGKVTRPGPDGSDHVVTLTAAITNTLTGQTATKVFTLTVKKMTDADAVREAAQNLSVYDAFTFDSASDIWESVTGGFLILTQGSYDTTISWTSGNTDVISIGAIDEATGKLQATIVRPAEKDASVILTAVITRGTATTTKTFLLIVKKEGAVRESTRQEASGIEFALASSITSDGLMVYRTVVDRNGVTTNIDTVIFDPEIVEQLVANINPNGSLQNRTLTLTMPVTDTDEQAIEIPAAAVSHMADHNVQLTVDSPFGGITVPSGTMKALADAGTDLYFRIRPIQDEDEREEISNAAVIRLGTGSDLIGTPLMVEANYSGSTYITIPFGDAEITSYGGLRIYVAHSDGTEEVLSGTLVYREGNSAPYGIRFLITSFSEFQLAKTTGTDEDGAFGSSTTLKELEEAFKSGDGYSFEGEGGLEAEFGPGDLDLDALRNGFGGASGDDIDITFTLKPQSPGDAANTGGILEGAGLDMTGTPFTFGAEASHGGTTIEIQTFESYVDILAPLADGQKITTAVRVGEDGSIIHIPTEVIIIDGNYYAKIHALVTGVFALIWNPLEMDDVAGHWSKDGVNDMASRLVVSGVGNNLFAPDRNITRAEFAAILVRGLGLLRGVGNQSFSDVPGGAWYAEYIETAVSYGLIYGYGGGRFGPDDTITREQAMAMLLRAMGLTGLNGTVSESEFNDILSAYTDAGELSDYAIAAAAGCIRTGVILGMDEDTLSPRSYITRAQAAVTVRRLLQYAGLID